MLGSGSEDEEDDEPTHHIRGGGLGLSALVGLTGNGHSDSMGAMGPSDMSVQSANSDSKITQDDSDQVSFCRKHSIPELIIETMLFFSFLLFSTRNERAQLMVIQIVVVIHKPKIKVPTTVQTAQNVAVHVQQSKLNSWMC